MCCVLQALTPKSVSSSACAGADTGRDVRAIIERRAGVRVARMVLLGATTAAATTAVPASVLLEDRCAAGMIGARGDKCVRIKAHPSHSIIESVHQWERDGLFPARRSSEDGSAEKPQRAVAPQVQRTAAPRAVTRSASAAHVSARAQVRTPDTRPRLLVFERVATCGVSDADVLDRERWMGQG